MIKYSHQLKAARRELLSLYDEIKQLRTTVSPNEQVIAIATFRAMTLETEISEFEKLRAENALQAGPSELHKIGDLLIAARIARGITQEELGAIVGFKMQQVQTYETDRYQSANLRRVLQFADALDVKIDVSGELIGTRAMSPPDLSRPFRFPLGGMHARGWLGSQYELMKEVRRNANELLADYFADSPVLRAPRRRYARTNGPPHEPAIAAWEARVMQLAALDPPQSPFRPELVDRAWLRAHSRLSSIQGGAKRAKQHLREVGIGLIVEPDLPPARIDSAVFRLDDTVTIALTLRDPREECFWPQLMHAIAHATLHVGPGQWDAIFDQAGAEAEAEFEEDADVFAREGLIPSSAWMTCLSRTRPTAQVMLADAERLGVSISVLTWRLKMDLGEEQLPRLTFGVRYVRKDLTISERRDGR